MRLGSRWWRAAEVGTKKKGDEGTILSKPITYLFNEAIHFGLADGKWARANDTFLIDIKKKLTLEGVKSKVGDWSARCVK